MQDYIVTSRDGSKHVRHRNVMPWHVNQVRNEYGMLQVFFGGPGTSARRETDMAFCSHFFFLAVSHILLQHGSQTDIKHGIFQPS